MSFGSFFIRTADVAVSKNVAELALLDGWSEAAEVEETPASAASNMQSSLDAYLGSAWKLLCDGSWVKKVL